MSRFWSMHFVLILGFIILYFFMPRSHPFRWHSEYLLYVIPIGLQIFIACQRQFRVGFRQRLVAGLLQASGLAVIGFQDFPGVRPICVSSALAIIIVAYAAVFGILTSAIAKLPVWFRKRRGECLSCGYCLVGNVSGRCPECGTDVVVDRLHVGK